MAAGAALRSAELGTADVAIAGGSYLVAVAVEAATVAAMQGFFKSLVLGRPLAARRGGELAEAVRNNDRGGRVALIAAIGGRRP